MGLFSKKKAPEDTAAQNREYMESTGIPVKQSSRRRNKFGAFSEYAKEKENEAAASKPLIPNRGPNSNPYAQMSNNHVGGGVDRNAGPNGGSFPPGGSNLAQQARQSPYATAANSRNNGYSSSQLASNSNSDLNQAKDDLFGGARNRTQPQQQPAGGRSALYAAAANNQPRRTKSRETMNTLDDLNADYDDYAETRNKPTGYQAQTTAYTPEYEEYEEKQEQQQEDEDVEGIKQELRFVKGESVASTRNTLRMAQEAEMSGQNAMGMLGAQGERLYNVERNLAIADTQAQIADDKVKELQKLNESIFAVHVGNPFNSKRKLREREQKLKDNRMKDKAIAEQQRSQVYQSEQRIKGALYGKPGASDTAQKYREKKIMDNAKKYQFEADSEDDEMETEISENLDQIDGFAKRLNKLALATRDEVDSQMDRLQKIGEDTDRLDINVHVNNSRLASIR